METQVTRFLSSYKLREDEAAQAVETEARHGVEEEDETDCVAEGRREDDKFKGGVEIRRRFCCEEDDKSDGDEE